VRRQPHKTIAGDATEQARAHPRKAGCCLVPRQRHGKRQSPAAVAAGNNYPVGGRGLLPLVAPPATLLCRCRGTKRRPNPTAPPSVALATTPAFGSH